MLNVQYPATMCNWANLIFLVLQAVLIFTHVIVLTVVLCG